MSASTKLCSYVGFSIKSGHLVWGADAVLRARGLKLVIADRSINRSSREDLDRMAQATHVPLVWTDAETLEACTHRHNCKCIGLTEPNLAQAALAELTRIGEEKE